MHVLDRLPVRSVASTLVSWALLIGAVAHAAQPDQLAPSDAVPEAVAAPDRRPIDFADWPHRRPHVILPPAWAFGVLYGGYTDQAGTLAKARTLVERGFPVDAVWVDPWYWDYARAGRDPKGYIDLIGDRDAFPDTYAEFPLVEDDGDSNAYQQGGVTVTWMRLRDAHGAISFEIEPSIGRFTGMLRERRVTVVVRTGDPIAGVRLNGQALAVRGAEADDGLPHARAVDQGIAVTFRHSSDAATRLVLDRRD